MKTRNGIWHSDFRLSSGERVRTSLGTKYKAEATRFERELLLKMEASLHSKPPHQMPYKGIPAAHSEHSGHPRGMTLSAAFVRAKREHEPWRASTSKKTIEDNYGHCAKYFKGDTDLATLSRESMLVFVEKLRDEDGLSASTINQRLSMMSVLIRYAEDWTHGVVKSFKMPRQKVRNGRIRILSYGEETKVLDWFSSKERTRPKSNDMGDLAAFLVDTGFRLGEALRLESVDIDWENEMVPAWETKADLPRQVPMTSRVSSILQSRSHLPQPFGMFTKDSADDHWEGMRKGIGINTTLDPEFVIHALRHTCASRLAASGMDAFRVQKWMGHKNINTTMKYVTLFGADLRDLSKALDSRRHDASQKSVHRPLVDVPTFGHKNQEITLRSVFSKTPRMPIPQGSPKGPSIGASVGVGLLIRRSLVRAQVGEPPNSGDSEEVDTNLNTFVSKIVP